MPSPSHPRRRNCERTFRASAAKLRECGNRQKASRPRTVWRSAFLIQGTENNDDSVFFAVRSDRFVYSDTRSPVSGNEVEFYDLASDPFEKNNGITSPRYQPVIRFFRELLRDLRSCVGASCWVTKVPPTLERSH